MGKPFAFSPCMAPRKVTMMEKSEQPIHWWRAFRAGMGGATLMMGFVDIFYLMGLTPFSFEYYLGVAIRGTQAGGPANWIVGLIANWIVGGFFGFFYAYSFEYIYKQSGAKIGALLGVGHALLAAIAFFPFFSIVHEFSGTGVYPRFGFFGSALGWDTPPILLIAHLLFGATMGLFYGPVRHERVRSRYFEPGESGMPGDPNVISIHEDPPDRLVV